MPILRFFLGLVLCCPLIAAAFGFADVDARAKALAAAEYRSPSNQLPAKLRDLDYDAFRDIRFKPDQAIWHAERLPFELQLFHQGRNFQEPVRINTVDQSGVKRLEFSPEMFDYGKNNIDPKLLRNLGFAGFRVHYAINTPSHKDEVAVFLGASYFRAVGRGQVYGLSARGLAIDTANAGGEEFPRFTEFWIDRPSRNSTSLTLYALLDSPSIAGAYRFVLTPGIDTVMQVSARVYPRKPIGKMGVAPLNSMYFFGENQPSSSDYRPEVHDSDGLSVATGDGQWLWRPLVDPQRLLVTSFASTNPKGFGVMQRDRAITSYEDPEAMYSERPSTWVEPVGNWGKGRIELVQIPTPDETNDNIVAYWVPDVAPMPGKRTTLAYKLHWQSKGHEPPKGWVVQSRRGHGPTKLADDEIQFVVDFDGPTLRALKSDAMVQGDVEVAGNGQLAQQNVFLDKLSGAWRMIVRVKRVDASKPVEMRGILKDDKENVLTETWAYIIPPEPEKP